MFVLPEKNIRVEARGPKLLIVDDSVIIQNAIRKYLKDHVSEIIGVAGDGKTALDIFQNTLSDLVTLDITMPEMDGFTVLERMIKIKPDVRVLVVTALSDDGTALDAMEKGACGFVKKPFSAEKLREAFAKICALDGKNSI